MGKRPAPYAPRRSKGFAPAGRLVADRIRAAGESRGFAVARVLTHWAEIAGADLAAIARPVDIRYGRKGFGATLTVLTTGAQAPLVEMQKERLRERVNACYGYAAVARIRITQTAPTGFAEGAPVFDPAPPAAPRPDPAVVAAARQAAAPVADPGLRDALAQLAENVMTAHRSKRGTTR
ncbi:DUF721 domain-containing protein [Rhodobacteraceae bacterium CCMM004]|nr:DUF721 domain-containing protein [Rhodobacteraceae bacterium CCMM004]